MRKIYRLKFFRIYCMGGSSGLFSDVLCATEGKNIGLGNQAFFQFAFERQQFRCGRRKGWNWQGAQSLSFFACRRQTSGKVSCGWTRFSARTPAGGIPVYGRNIQTSSSWSGLVGGIMSEIWGCPFLNKPSVTVCAGGFFDYFGKTSFTTQKITQIRKKIVCDENLVYFCSPFKTKKCWLFCPYQAVRIFFWKFLGNFGIGIAT